MNSTPDNSCSASPNRAHHFSIHFRYVRDPEGRKQKQNYGICAYCSLERIYPTTTQLLEERGLAWRKNRKGEFHLVPKRWLK